MVSDAVQFFHSQSLVSFGSLIRKPAAIVGALGAIFMVGEYYFREPTSQNNCDEVVLEKPELFGRLCTRSLDGSCSSCRPGFNPSFCEQNQLNDSDWQSLFLKNEVNDLIRRDFSFAIPCRAFKEKLLFELTKDFKDVASKMGYVEFDKLSVNINNDMGDGAAVSLDNVLHLSSRKVAGWWNSEASQQRKQERGIFAHEIAHLILEHFDRKIIFHLTTLATLVQRALFAPIPLPVLIKIRELSIESLSKNCEREADLLTLKVPEYARGLLDYFNHRLLECEKFKHPPPNCDDGGPEHPPLRHRVAYLTDALCAKYPAINQDICQCGAPGNSSEINLYLTKECGYEHASRN